MRHRWRGWGSIIRLTVRLTAHPQQPPESGWRAESAVYEAPVAGLGIHNTVDCKVPVAGYMDIHMLHLPVVVVEVVPYSW